MKAACVWQRFGLCTKDAHEGGIWLENLINQVAFY